MHVALAISKLFPAGGLQRDCVAIANTLVQAGHRATIVTTEQKGRVALDAAVEIRPILGLSTAGRDLTFGRWIATQRHRFDRVVGFNKMPGLDLYYCADPPYVDIRRPWYRRLGWKYRVQQKNEMACFGAGADASVIVLQAGQQSAYRRVWGTPDSHFRLLPTSLNPARLTPVRHALERDEARKALALADASEVWLAITGVPKVKGLDRTLEALARTPSAQLIVAGVTEGTRAGAWMQKQAARLGVASRVKLLGYREDIVGVMAAADVLVHPARLENTGNAILEAIVNGLPAIVTECCGYSGHIAKAQAGVVLPEPFGLDSLMQALGMARDPHMRALWSANGIDYGAREDLTSGHAVAASLIVGPLWARNGAALP